MNLILIHSSSNWTGLREGTQRQSRTSGAFICLQMSLLTFAVSVVATQELSGHGDARLPYIDFEADDRL